MTIYDHPHISIDVKNLSTHPLTIKLHGCAYHQNTCGSYVLQAGKSEGIRTVCHSLTIKSVSSATTHIDLTTSVGGVMCSVDGITKAAQHLRPNRRFEIAAYDNSYLTIEVVSDMVENPTNIYILDRGEA